MVFFIIIGWWSLSQRSLNTLQIYPMKIDGPQMVKSMAENVPEEGLKASLKISDCRGINCGY